MRWDVKYKWGAKTGIYVVFVQNVPLIRTNTHAKFTLIKKSPHTYKILQTYPPSLFIQKGKDLSFCKSHSSSGPMSEWLQLCSWPSRPSFSCLKSKHSLQPSRACRAEMMRRWRAEPIHQRIKNLTCLTNIATAHEEGRPFDDPPLPRYARGVPQAGSSQVSTLKPHSCISITP